MTKKKITKSQCSTCGSIKDNHLIAWCVEKKREECIACHSEHLARDTLNEAKRRLTEEVTKLN